MKYLGATVSVVRNQLTAVRSVFFFFSLRGLKCLEAINTLHFPCGSVVKTPLAMQEIWVLSMGLEDPLEKEMATHSSILAWKNPINNGAWQVTVHGSQKSLRLNYITEWLNNNNNNECIAFKSRGIFLNPRERRNPVGFRASWRLNGVVATWTISVWWHSH